MQLLIHPICNHLCEHFANLVKKENAPVIVRFSSASFLEQIEYYCVPPNLGNFPRIKPDINENSCERLENFLLEQLKKATGDLTLTGSLARVNFSSGGPLSAPGCDLSTNLSLASLFVNRFS